MFRDLKAAKSTPRELRFKTGNENGESIVPRIVWRAARQREVALKK